MNYDPEQVRRIVVDEMEHWPLHHAGLVIDVRALSDGKLWIGYGVSREHRLDYHNRTHFDLNIDWPICYLVGIGLHPVHRGQGHGSQLYQLVETIAVRLDCEAVEMMPSGTTVTGESRRAWCHRRGYRDVRPDGDVIKQVRQVPNPDLNGGTHGESQTQDQTL